MQIFELYSDIETPILTMWIGLTKTFQICKSMLRDSFSRLRGSALADERFSDPFLTHSCHTWHTRFLKYGVIYYSINIDKVCLNL